MLDMDTLLQILIIKSIFLEVSSDIMKRRISGFVLMTFGALIQVIKYIYMYSLMIINEIQRAKNGESKWSMDLQWRELIMQQFESVRIY